VLLATIAPEFGDDPTSDATRSTPVSGTWRSRNGGLDAVRAELTALRKRKLL